MTLDLLRADGQHLGGAILPGVNTSLDDFRRIFRHIDFSDPAIAQSDDPGCSTEAAIQINYGSGAINALAGLVNRWSGILGDDPGVIIAGGDAAQVQNNIDPAGRIVPDLVFLGMRRLVNL